MIFFCLEMNRAFVKLKVPILHIVLYLGMGVHKHKEKEDVVTPIIKDLTDAIKSPLCDINLVYFHICIKSGIYQKMAEVHNLQYLIVSFNRPNILRKLIPYSLGL